MNEDFIERWVRRLRDEIPDAVAIFLVGSVARGDAGPHSDLDFDVVVADGPRDDGPTWFEVEQGRLVCVSVWIRDVDRWLADELEVQDWALGLRAVVTVRLRWAADDSWRARLERSERPHPAAPPEFEHLLGDLGKVANAYRRGDDLGVRSAAHELARACITVVQVLNPVPPVHSRQAALLAALGFDIVPPGYRDDLVVCLGMTGRATTAREVFDAASHLATGIVDLLEAHTEAFRPQLSRPLASALADGTLRRYVLQLTS